MREDITCPACGSITTTSKTVGLPDDKVVTCPKCDNKFRLGNGRFKKPDGFFDGSQPVSDRPKKPQHAPKFNAKVVVWLLVLLVAVPGITVASIYFMTFSISGERWEVVREKRTALNNTNRAQELVRKAVLEGLVAPTTAKFELNSEHVKGRVFFTRGNVTSQNAFGAMLTKKLNAVCVKEEDSDLIQIYILLLGDQKAEFKGGWESVRLLLADLDPEKFPLKDDEDF